MNPTKHKPSEKAGYMGKLAGAKAIRHDDTSSIHSLRGTCTSTDLFANWDDEGLMHLIHTTLRNDKHENIIFPSAKPWMFTGCLLEEKDKEELVSISVKLSFHKDEEKSNTLQVDGDGMIFFDHFDVHGHATKIQNEPLEYQLELRVVKADEVGG